MHLSGQLAGLHCSAHPTKSASMPGIIQRPESMPRTHSQNLQCVETPACILVTVPSCAEPRCACRARVCGGTLMAIVRNDREASIRSTRDLQPHMNARHIICRSHKNSSHCSLQRCTSRSLALGSRRTNSHSVLQPVEEMASAVMPRKFRSQCSQQSYTSQMLALDYPRTSPHRELPLVEALAMAAMILLAGALATATMMPHRSLQAPWQSGSPWQGPP